MTNLDGGLFNIEIAFSPRFPNEQPRAKFLTPFYHYRVTSKEPIADLVREALSLTGLHQRTALSATLPPNPTRVDPT